MKNPFSMPPWVADRKPALRWLGYFLAAVLVTFAAIWLLHCRG